MKNPIQMIKQCNEKDEPYFLLRGQDICALPAIETYLKGKKQWIQNLFAIVLNIKEIEKHVLIR